MNLITIGNFIKRCSSLKPNNTFKMQHHSQTQPKYNPKMLEFLDLYLNPPIKDDTKDSNTILKMKESNQMRINKLYLPIFQYINDLYINHKKITESNSTAGDATINKTPLFIGLSAPQGCGKTTLTNIISELFHINDINCVVMSLDDFYKTGEDQDMLASKHPHNPLLQFRGNAGTHDLSLAISCLENIKNPKINEITQVPRYDKSLRNGRGDRSDPREWTDIQPHSTDIVVFEGWMLGFTATNITSMSNNLQEINEELVKYKDLHDMFDAWLVLAVNDVDIVYQWRLEAERSMRAMGKPSLTDEQVRDFVSRFMPAYETYLPHLYLNGPQRKTNSVPYKKVTVGADRLPIEDISIN